MQQLRQGAPFGYGMQQNFGMAGQGYHPYGPQLMNLNLAQDYVDSIDMMDLFHVVEDGPKCDGCWKQCMVDTPTQQIDEQCPFICNNCERTPKWRDAKPDGMD